MKIYKTLTIISLLPIGLFSSLSQAVDLNPSDIVSSYFKLLSKNDLTRAAELHDPKEIEACNTILKQTIKELKDHGAKSINFGMRYYGDFEVPIEKAANSRPNELFGYALYGSIFTIVSKDNPPRIIGHLIEGDNAFVVYEQDIKQEELKNNNDFFVFVLKKYNNEWKVTLNLAVTDFCATSAKTIEMNNKDPNWTFK